MQISLSDHFTYKKLLRFTLPSIIMMIFTSIYGVVDGFFVSNFVGKASFTAVNLIMPFLMILGAVGFMFGTGGSAIIGRTMGEGDDESAQNQFSMFIYVSIVLGIVIAIFGILFMRPVAAALGANGELLENCVIYGRLILLALPAFILQYEFQSFFVTAEKPNLGLYITVLSGLTNIILDAVLVGMLRMGVSGAAVATGLSEVVGGILPIIYFAKKNSSRLRLRKTSIDYRILLKASINGSSELMSNISMSLVSMLYNSQLLKYAGEDGVAAYGVLMYVTMIFLAAYIGYSVGTAPIVSYHYGAGHGDELKNLLYRSLKIIAVFALFMFGAAELLARPLSQLFVGYDAGLLSLTIKGFFIYSFSYLFCGFSIYGSGFFTALNDGLVSALISFLRTVVFQVLAVFLLPLIFGIDGIWLSIVVAEIMAVIITVILLVKKRAQYHY